MSRREEVVLVDDLDGTEFAAEVAFGIDGVGYVIDLADHNEVALRAALEPYIAKARRTSGRNNGGRRTRSTSTSSGTSGAERERNAEIRAWATGRGYEVSAQGRLPREVREAWEAR